MKNLLVLFVHDLDSHVVLFMIIFIVLLLSKCRDLFWLFKLKIIR